MTDDHMIDNAATASQIDFDAVTREAIKLNIIDPLRAASFLERCRNLTGHGYGEGHTEEDIYSTLEACVKSARSPTPSSSSGWPTSLDPADLMLQWMGVYNMQGEGLMARAVKAVRDDYLKKAADYAALPQPSPWRNMACAPKDGKHCILAVKSGAFVYSVQGAYMMGEWHNAADIKSEPLCWMPNVMVPAEFLPWTDEFKASAALSATATEGE